MAVLFSRKPKTEPVVITESNVIVLNDQKLNERLHYMQFQEQHLQELKEILPVYEQISDSARILSAFLAVSFRLCSV